MRLAFVAALAGIAFVTVCAATPSAVAQAAASAAQPARFDGVVTAMTATQITATGADGATLTITAAPDAWIVKTRPIQASEIHAGDFVATANVNNADGTGTSTELRVFPAGMHLGEGSYPMREANTTMTNATVAQVTDVSGGRRLTVTYGASAAGTPAGTRTITLPDSVHCVQWYRVALSDIHVGDRVRGLGAADNGVIAADFILADTPAAAH
jgi:hypothetical protein